MGAWVWELLKYRKLWHIFHIFRFLEPVFSCYEAQLKKIPHWFSPYSPVQLLLSKAQKINCLFGVFEKITNRSLSIAYL